MHLDCWKTMYKDKVDKVIKEKVDGLKKIFPSILNIMPGPNKMEDFVIQ